MKGTESQLKSLLCHMRVRAEDSQLCLLLEPLNKAVQDRVREYDEVEDSETRDLLHELQNLDFEELFGVQFVICQRWITAVVSIVDRLHDVAEAMGRPLRTIAKKKQEIMDYGYCGQKISEIARINASANFFKHRDEWGKPWRENGSNKETLAKIRALGVKDDTKDSFQKLAQPLCDAHQTEYLSAALLKALKDWGLSLAMAIGRELDLEISGIPHCSATKLPDHNF